MKNNIIIFILLLFFSCQNNGILNEEINQANYSNIFSKVKKMDDKTQDKIKKTMTCLVEKDFVDSVSSYNSNFFDEKTLNQLNDDYNKQDFCRKYD